MRKKRCVTNLNKIAERETCFEGATSEEEEACKKGKSCCKGEAPYKQEKYCYGTLF